MHFQKLDCCFSAGIMRMSFACNGMKIQCSVLLMVSRRWMVIVEEHQI